MKNKNIPYLVCVYMFVEWNIYFVQNRFHRIQWVATKSFKSTNTFVVHHAMQILNVNNKESKFSYFFTFTRLVCMSYTEMSLCEFKFKFSLYCYIRNFQQNTHCQNVCHLDNFLHDSVLIVQFIRYLIFIFLTTLIYYTVNSALTNHLLHILNINWYWA